MIVTAPLFTTSTALTTLPAVLGRLPQGERAGGSNSLPPLSLPPSAAASSSSVSVFGADGLDTFCSSHAAAAPPPSSAPPADFGLGGLPAFGGLPGGAVVCGTPAECGRRGGR